MAAIEWTDLNGPAKDRNVRQSALNVRKDHLTAVVVVANVRPKLAIAILTAAPSAQWIDRVTVALTATTHLVPTAVTAATDVEINGRNGPSHAVIVHREFAKNVHCRRARISKSTMTRTTWKTWIRTIRVTSTGTSQAGRILCKPSSKATWRITSEMIIAADHHADDLVHGDNREEDSDPVQSVKK